MTEPQQPEPTDYPEHWTPWLQQKLVEKAAKAQTEAEYWRRLQASVAVDAMKRFSAELRNGAADQIIESLRPAFDDVAKQITDATSVVDFTWSPEQLVAQGDPEQLTAYRQLPSLVARVDKFAAGLAGFGRHGDFAVIDQPQHLVHNELIGLRDESLFVTDSDPWRASDLINARRAAWQSSPWLRMTLRLNTVAEAKERLRVLCEAAFDSMESRRGEQGRLTADGYKADPKRKNPFKLPEPAAPAAPSEEPSLDDADVLDLERIVAK